MNVIETSISSIPAHEIRTRYKEMATSSFFINIDINDKKTALRFLEAMEKAEKAAKKKIDIKYSTINDKEIIKTMFK